MTWSELRRRSALAPVIGPVIVAVGIGACAVDGADERESAPPVGPPVRCGATEQLGMPGENASITFPGCSDRKTYGIRCDDCRKAPYTCACLVNGKATGKAVTTSSAMCIGVGHDDVATINAACGWNLQ